MSMTKKTVNGIEYTFFNSSYGNRSGFVHESELYRDGKPMGGARIQYYNRTWECYQFQTVMAKIVGELIEICEESYKTAWKNEHDVKRLTKAKSDIMWADFQNNPPMNYIELTELYSML